ncbi:MAG: MotA/TolQ/ExbB proton channel family protein [Planctomycetes bacterium]|nr:MotA/TolQ/ExbB proton channel family protein [Planctomycetota bacterium]
MRMDTLTLFGLIFGASCVAISILMGASWNFSSLFTYVDYPSIFIVAGGTIAALSIAHPGSDLRGLMKVVMNSVKTNPSDTYELIEKIVHYSDMARRNGLLSIEHAMDPADDAFLRRGLRYAIDGMDRDQILSNMQAELDNIAARHSGGKRMLDSLKDFGPAWGMLGTLLGLIAMLQNMSDPKTIGPSMAIALITSLYGALSAFLVFGPMGTKLAIRHEEEALNKEVIIQGVLGIQAGENPKALKGRLLIYLSPKLRGEELEA